MLKKDRFLVLINDPRLNNMSNIKEKMLTGENPLF